MVELFTVKLVAWMTGVAVRLLKREKSMVARMLPPKLRLFMGKVGVPVTYSTSSVELSPTV